MTDDPLLFDPDAWCPLSFAERRESLAAALRSELLGEPGVQEVLVEAGTVGREYDFTVLLETDVGRMRAPLWSHARAVIFCDTSVHPANRRQLAPGLAVREAVAHLRTRLAVPFTLESRGLSVTLSPESGVQRTWTAERALFRNRTAVTREDRVENPAPDLDVRDLLAHFYSGPSLRLVGADGQAFLLPGRSEVEAPLVSLCHACGRWAEGALERCPHCGSTVDPVLAARPPRR